MSSVAKSITMPASMERELEELAQRQQRSQSWLIRAAIEALIEKERKERQLQNDRLVNL